MKTKKFVINKPAKIQNDGHSSDKANFLSHFLFCWQLPIMWKIKRNKITTADFATVPKNLNSRLLGKKLKKNWDKQQLLKKPSLATALFQTFRLELLLFGGIFFASDITITIVQPVYLRKLLNYFTPNQATVTKNEAYFYSSVIILATLLKVVTFQFFMLHFGTTGMKMRTACSSLLYQHLLTVRKSRLQKLTSGFILNLFSNTVDRFDRAVLYVQILWTSIIKVIMLTVIIYIWGGWRATVGTTILYGFLIFQSFIGKMIRSRMRKMAVEKDFRIRIISDVISGIRTIKMYAWEKYFSDRIETARREELKHVTSSNHLQTANVAAVIYFDKFPVYSYMVLAVLAKSLDVKLIFMIISAMDLIKVAVMFISISLNNLSELKTSFERIQEFLLNSEEDEVLKETRGKGLIVKNLTAKWNSSLVLKNIDFEAFAGQLVAIIGSAGSGKSTLLQAVLREPTVSGTIEVGGSLSYASQEPWIIPATLRANIIFGEKEDEVKYRRVLRVCALEYDLALFPHGDNTLVGERGVMLSGGQKARVGLARAVYKDSDVYLLDDPLAAVDASVATQIFTECLLGYLKEKTVVLVTHQLRFLSSVDKIYLLEDGEVKSWGKYENLQSLIGRSLQSYEEKQVETSEMKREEKKQVEVEEDEGDSTMNRYRSYLLSSGHWSLLLLQVLLFILCQCCLSGTSFFLTFWINTRETVLKFTDLNFLEVYTALILASIFVSHLSTSFYTWCGRKISINLHKNLFVKTLQASMKFFDHHASGRLVGRFSRDLGVIDEVIPKVLYELIRQCSFIVGACIIIIIVNYWMVFPTVALLVLFYIIQWLFAPSLGFLRKTAATRKSPIFTHVTTTIQGLPTIRALEAESKFLSSYHDSQDSFNTIEYTEEALYFCFGFWADLVCAMYTIIVVLITMGMKDTAVGNVGLSLTQSFLIMCSAQYALKLYGQLDSFMSCVERVVKYTDLDVEKDEEHSQVPESWPSEGKVVFDSLSLRYDYDKPLVLNQVNLTIQPGEKLGIVGRTGAGKSSLVSTLFRLYDFQGRILIDDVDTKLVSLKTLRSRLAVIPQDPVFFPGTLRQNLDPFGEFEDGKFWSVLEDVRLKTFVSNLPLGLESPILEGGGNFSVGQRQLLCLVRAILKNAKIVVFDEATANVDLETDEIIQATIRRRFKKSTVLTIAHRLDTIMDSDKILVMEDGRVVEFGATKELLRNGNSAFYQYVNQK